MTTATRSPSASTTVSAEPVQAPSTSSGRPHRASRPGCGSMPTQSGPALGDRPVQPGPETLHRSVPSSVRAATRPGARRPAGLSRPPPPPPPRPRSGPRRRRRSRTAASCRSGRGTGAATRPWATAAAVAAARSTSWSSCTTPIAPSTRTSATPGAPRSGSRPVPQARLDPRRPRPPSRRPAAAPMEALATAQASGLPMNVGPCASTPRRRGDAPGHPGGAQRRGERQVAAGQRLADAHHVRADPGVLGGEQRPGAAEPGGDLVEDQQHAVRRGSPRAAPAGSAGWWKRIPPAPCTTGSTITAASSSACRATVSRQVATYAGVGRRVEPGRRGVGENLPGQHAAPTGGACRPPGRRRTSGGRCRRGSRPARWPAGAAAGPPAARWYCRHILTATSTLHRAGVGRGRRAPAPSGVISTRVRASRTAGSWVSPPNITWLIRPSWSVHRRVEHRVPVAVDRRPPGRHPVDQLPAVGQPQPHPLGRSTT